MPCGSQDTTRSGWVPPLGRHGSEFVHATSGFLMICCKRQDKLLPAAVDNEALEEKVLQFEEREARKLPAKERRSLKDEVIFSLLPKAFARSSLQFAYIAPKDNLLVVNATQGWSVLRRTVGSVYRPCSAGRYSGIATSTTKPQAQFLYPFLVKL